MFVPGYGEASPEAKVAKNLQDFFTYIAVKIILAHLESYNPEGYEELMEFVNRNSLNNGDKLCSLLMRESPRHKGLEMTPSNGRSRKKKLVASLLRHIAEDGLLHTTCRTPNYIAPEVINNKGYNGAKADL